MATVASFIIILLLNTAILGYLPAVSSKPERTDHHSSIRELESDSGGIFQ